MKRYIDRLIVIGNYNIIDGIKTIPMINGVDMELISPIHPTLEDGAIHIMAIAKIEWWHGYDRFLKGMAQYYQSGGQRGIVLHLVGTGEAHASLVAMVKGLGLESCVIIHGYKVGKELDEIYNRCHLGLISLAMPRIMTRLQGNLRTRLMWKSSINGSS